MRLNIVSPGKQLGASDSWIHCLSCQGTWGDSIVIQAVAGLFNLKILIIESHLGFAEITIVEGVG